MCKTVLNQSSLRSTTRPPVFSVSSVSPWLTLWVLFLLWPAFVFGAGFQDLPEANRKQWVEHTITGLDADTLRERALAERELMEAGPEVLPWLPAPELLPNTAVRQTVRRIRLRLEEAKARDSVKASRVTIKGTFTLQDIIKNITNQTGNRIDVGLLPAEMLNRTLDLKLEKVPFWETLGVIEDAFGLNIRSPQPANAEPPAIRLIPANAENPPTQRTFSGAFLVEADSLKLKPRFGDPDQQLLRVPLRITAEPRLRPLFLKLAGTDFSARTAKGMPLAPFNPAARLELPLGEDGTESAYFMDFLVPQAFGNPPIELAGKATLTVAADSEEITFRDLTKDMGAARRRGGVTVTLNEIAFQPDENHPNKQSAKFRITVYYDTGGPAFESHRTWMFHNRVYLEDAQGRKRDRNSDFHTALQTDGGVIVEYNFDNLTGQPADFKFTYIAPTLIINVPVSFEFKNLPVPKTP